MLHKAWSSIWEVPYCISRSSVKFQGHTALKIFEFDPDWAFPDCNSSLNSPMAMKCCTKLEVAWKRCPIVFKVIHPISRSQGPQNQWFSCNFSISGQWNIVWVIMRWLGVFWEHRHSSCCRWHWLPWATHPFWLPYFCPHDNSNISDVVDFIYFQSESR